MVCGLAAAVLMMVLEMVLYILRAVQMEHSYEHSGGARKTQRAIEVTKDRSAHRDVINGAETVTSSVLKDKSV